MLDILDLALDYFLLSGSESSGDPNISYDRPNIQLVQKQICKQIDSECDYERFASFADTDITAESVSSIQPPIGVLTIINPKISQDKIRERIESVVSNYPSLECEKLYETEFNTELWVVGTKQIVGRKLGK